MVPQPSRLFEQQKKYIFVSRGFAFLLPQISEKKKDKRESSLQQLFSDDTREINLNDGNDSHSW